MARSNQSGVDDAKWLRQPGESEKAFAAFQCYLDLGDERTISAVGQKLGKSRSQIDAWRGKFNWKERAQAYDNFLVSDKAKKTRREVEARYERFGKVSDQLLAFSMSTLKTANPKDSTIRDITNMLQVALKLADANKDVLTPPEESESVQKMQDGFLEAFDMFKEDDE